ncbi:tape measure protein [Cupriavidus sp. YAF13]|uniref:tape measure protein n=1 Tax=Cupriavidus sp. YAF13 TaxID=3233075 RepID=UPI003F91642C
MADNNTDVSLRVTASTDGAESIRKLADDVRNLAKQGGDAAPEFQRLAAELDRLSGQATAVQNFSDLRHEIEQLAVEQKKSADSAGELNGKLRELSVTTGEFQVAEAQAKQEVRDAQRGIAEKRDALARLKLEYDDTGKQSADYKQQVQALNLSILDAKAALRDKRDALVAAQQATKGAADAEQQLSAQSKLANAEVKATTRELTQRNAALNEAQAALKATGVASEDVATAQADVRKAFADTAAAVEQQQAALVERRQAESAAAELAKQAAAEEDRLATIQQNNRYRLAAAAREQLDAERTQYAESARLARNATDAKIAAERQYSDFVKGSAQARKALDDAFAQTGVRSARSVELEISKVNAALHVLANDASVSGAEFDRAFAGAQRRIEALKNSLNDVPEAMNKTSTASRLVTNAFGQLAAAYGGIELATKFINANVQLESLRRSLAITSGSTQDAARQIEFLRTTANSSGIAIGSISDSYLRFSVSARQAGISAKVVEDVFAAVTRMSGQMGLSSERAALALEALSQMASKGTVSMEELRQQLGDSLPGALKLAADGLGLTVKQMTSMVENGQVMAADMLPALASALTKTIAKGTDDVQGFQATWARLKNTMTLAAQTIGDTGAMDALGVSLRTVGVIAGSVAMGVSTTLDIVFTGVKQLATLTAGVVHGDLKGALEESGRLGDQFIERQAKFGRALQDLAGVGEKTTAAQSKAGAAAVQTGTQAASAVVGVNANAQAQRAATAAATEHAQAQGQSGAAAVQAGAQAAGSAAGWYTIQAAYKEVNKQAEANTVIAEKLAAAKKAEGAAAVQLATMAGNEIELRRTAAQAADADHTALQRLSDARQQEVNNLKAQVESLNAAAAASGGLRDDQKEQIKTLTDLVDKKQAEAEHAKQSADAAAIEAQSRHLVSETYKDNAANLDTLRAAAAEAANELTRMRAQETDTASSHALVAEAARNAAFAEGLYRDALADTANAAARKVAILRQDEVETSIALRGRLAWAKTQEQEAQLYGQVGQAAEMRIRQKQIEIEQVRSHMAAVDAETKATLAEIEAKRAELAVSGQLTPEKQAEIDLRIRNAQAKQLEAQQGEQAIRQLQNEIIAIRNRNIEAENSQRIDGAAQESRIKSHTNGSVTASQNDGLMSLAAKQKAGTLGADDLKTAQAAFQAADFNFKVMQQYRSQFTLDSQTSVTAAYTQSKSILDAVQAAAAKGGAGTSGSKTAQPGTGTRTVNINIGGKSTAVNVASEADANNLTGVMRQLESLSGRSNA